jgi:hypothetical protein
MLVSKKSPNLRLAVFDFWHLIGICLRIIKIGSLSNKLVTLSSLGWWTTFSVKASFSAMLLSAAEP